MKNKIFIVVVFVLQAATAQIFNQTPHIIDDDARGGFLTIGDINNDGKPDIIFVSPQMLVWYENDGLGIFSGPVVIDTEQGQSFNINATDLDQDGHLDILVSSFGHDRLYFYRNLGGGNFAPRQVLVENLDRVSGVEAVDLDGDGDLDLVIGITNSVGLYWMEHLDGQGGFAVPTPISTTLAQARNQKIGDINGDGYPDILSNSGGSILLSWFENDGQGNFTTQHIIETTGFYNIDLFLVDIDNDGDFDIVSYGGNGVFWYENLDGLGNFSSKHIINPTSDSNITYSQLYPYDIDNNGSIDVVYLSSINNGINYQLNDGSGNFSAPFFVDPPVGTTSGGNYPVDIDGDGDMDLINIAVINGNPNANHRILWWYENQTILSVEDSHFKELTVIPNPTDGLLSIVSNALPIKKVKLYQTEGKVLKTIHTGFEAIDVSSLASGVYFILIEFQEGTRVVKTVIKK